ncbi:hypothetical protein LCGC14_0445390 [marine sediment metagenome]|uniref:DUF6538 domain-containing protein n=1 Tax=marine sediment metagenome TaxID=412755 RepID=A0A0F9T2C5_9ZZZZ
MAIGANLERRGAVYYWRKRLPKGLALRIGTNHVRLSLRTREVREARYLAASLNARAADVLMNDTPRIGRDQLETIFRRTFEAHRRKLALLADLARVEQGFDPEADTADETAMGWAYRLFARKGLNATLDETDRHSFRQAGIDPEAMTLLEATVERMKSNGEATPSKARLAEVIQVSGAELTAGTVAQATPVYLRALGEALLRTEERYRFDALDFGALTEPTRTRREMSDAEITHRPETGRQGLAEPVPVTTPQAMTASSQPRTSAAVDNSDVAEATPWTASADSVKAVGEKLINQKLGDGLWDDKTARQARMIFDLFDRFLREEALITALSDLCQTHLDAFDAFLRTLFKSYGKSPKDRQRSVAALRLESARRPETERGLSGATRNRHLTFLGQLLRRGKSAGIVIDTQLDLTEFRARKAKRGRDDRPVPTHAQIESFFHMPVFTGCREWNDIHGTVRNSVCGRA